MHPLTRELLKDGCHSLYMDKLITDYLNGRAEWLKSHLIHYHTGSMNEWRDVCGYIDQAFELSPPQPRPEMPEKLMEITGDMALRKTINQLIACVEEMRKEVK